MVGALPSLPSLFDAPRVTAESIANRRKLAAALQQQALDPNGGGGSMLGAIGQGLKGVAGGLLEGQEARQAAEAEQKRAGYYADLAAALAGGGGTPVTMGAVPTPGAAMAPAMPRPAPAPPAASGAPVAGKTGPGEVYAGLVARGVPTMVAAGMVGNIGAESAFKLDVSDNRGEGSTGLIQARGSRLTALKQLGAETGRPTFSLDNQLDHIVSEFQGPEKRAFDIASKAQTPGEAAIALAKHYERPADWALRESAPKRAGLAESVFREQANQPVAGGSEVSFLTEPRDPNGGFYVPPADRAMAPAGDPSGPLPGDVAMPAPPPAAPPSDVAALFQPAPMGDGGGFMPSMGVPMPPPRPPEAALATAALSEPAQAPMPVSLPEQAVTAPPVAAPAPDAVAPQGMPLPPVRPPDLYASKVRATNPLDLAQYADGPADMPVAGGVPARGQMPGIDPIVAGLGGAPQVSPQAQRLAGALAQAPSANGPIADNTNPIANNTNPQPLDKAPASPSANGRTRALMGILQDPYASPGEQQFALKMLEREMDTSTTTVDLGDTVGILDKRGNLVGSMPKTKTSVLSDGQSMYDNTGKLIVAAPEKLTNVPGGTTVFDPKTRQPVFTAPSQQETFRSLVTPQDRAAAGIPANDTRPYQVGSDGKLVAPAGGVNVTVDNKAENAEAAGRGAGVSKRLNELADDGSKARDDALLYRRFGDILSTVNTGKSTETLEKIRQATGITLDPNTDNVQALNSLIQYMAPRLRVPGAGAQSDKELDNFMRSIPTLAGTPGGNKQILDTLSGLVDHRVQRATIASEWQLGDISAKEAQKRIDALPAPFAPVPPAVLAPGEGASVAPPAPAIEALRGNPGLRDQFDAKFGKGAADRVLARPVL